MLYCASRRCAEGAVGAGAVQELIVVLHGERPADRKLVAYRERGQVFAPGGVLFQRRGQHARDERRAGMTADGAVAVVDIKGVAAVAHGDRRAEEVIPPVRADGGDVAQQPHALRQLLSRLELFAVAAEDQRRHQIDTAHDRVLLHRGGKIVPFRVQRVALRAIIRFKFHIHSLHWSKAGPGRRQKMQRLRRVSASFCFKETAS